MEDVGDVVTLDGAKAGGGEGDSRAVVEEVQDLDRTAVGQRPGRGVGLPGFVGQLGRKADEGRLGPFLGLRCDEAVAVKDPPDGGTDGGSLTFLERWKWMVCGPASCPAAASSQRSLMISFWILAATWWEHDRGRRERGSKEAYPPCSNLSSIL